eukprot:254359-Prorocentrum_minimum.AAC.3
MAASGWRRDARRARRSALAQLKESADGYPMLLGPLSECPRWGSGGCHAGFGRRARREDSVGAGEVQEGGTI